MGQHDVSDEELDDLFGAESNDLKNEAIKALKKSSTTKATTAPKKATKPKTEVKVEEVKAEEEVVVKKKKHQVGISHRTDLGDDRDYSYRDDVKEEVPEMKQEVVVDDDDIDAILGIEKASFKEDSSDEKDEIDTFMTTDIQAEDEKFDKEDEVEYDDDTNKKSWDPDEDDEDHVSNKDDMPIASTSTEDEEEDEADAMDNESSSKIVKEDDFDFEDGDIELPEGFEDEEETVAEEEKATTEIVEEEITVDEDIHEEITISSEEVSKVSEIVGDSKVDENVVESAIIPSEELDEKTVVETVVDLEPAPNLSYDEMSFLDKMRKLISEAGICKRASYLQDSDLLDFYIEKYETVKYCEAYAPDFDMDVLRAELEAMIVPIFEDKILSLDQINFKLQQVQSYRNRVVEIRLAFLKNYTFRKRALKRLQDNLMKCSKEKSIDKRSGEIAIHLGDLERDFDMVDDFYKCVEMVFDNLNHTQDVISRMITCIQERNKRIDRGEQPYEQPISDTEAHMPRKHIGKKASSPKTADWDDIDK
jgi:hypothetical protein